MHDVVEYAVMVYQKESDKLLVKVYEQLVEKNMLETYLNEDDMRRTAINLLVTEDKLDSAELKLICQLSMISFYDYEYEGEDKIAV